MVVSKYIDFGREIGQKMLEARAANPDPLQKATNLVLGIMAVLKQEGLRVTVPLLESSAEVCEAFKVHGIPEDRIKPAVKEANRRWEKESEQLLSAPLVRKSAKKTTKTDASLSEHSSEITDNAAADAAIPNASPDHRSQNALFENNEASGK